MEEQNETEPNYMGDAKTSCQSVRHKEKRRTESLNKAFSDLRQRIPHVPRDTKLSKIKTLQLASSYIQYLSSVLHNPLADDGQNDNQQGFNIAFKPCLTRPRKSNRNFPPKSKNASPDMSRFSDFSISPETTRSSKFKRTKGRTGWPEAVWAEALESGSKISDSNSAINEEDGMVDGLSFPPVPTFSFPYETTDISQSDEMEMYMVATSHNQPYFENKQTLPLFMLANDAECGYLKSCFPNVDHVIQQQETQATKQLNQAITSANPLSEDTTCSSIPDVFHASAITFPLVSTETSHEPLPSIATLRSCRRDWSENNVYPEFQSTDLSGITSDIIDFAFQNSRAEEPSFVELQPVNRFSRKCAETI